MWVLIFIVLCAVVILFVLGDFSELGQLWHSSFKITLSGPCRQSVALFLHWVARAPRVSRFLLSRGILNAPPVPPLPPPSSSPASSPRWMFPRAPLVLTLASLQHEAFLTLPCPVPGAFRVPPCSQSSHCWLSALPPMDRLALSSSSFTSRLCPPLCPLTAPLVFLSEFLPPAPGLPGSPVAGRALRQPRWVGLPTYSFAQKSFEAALFSSCSCLEVPSWGSFSCSVALLSQVESDSEVCHGFGDPNLCLWRSPHILQPHKRLLIRLIVKFKSWRCLRALQNRRNFTFLNLYTIGFIRHIVSTD